jgi:RNase H-fold protein (predicted Holliday junction resolvase)
MWKSPLDIMYFRWAAICVRILLVIGASFEGYSCFQINVNRLGIDYAPRWIGIAYSAHGFIQPYKTIRNTGDLVAVAKTICRVAVKYRAAEMILGVPTGTDGNMNRPTTYNGNLCVKFSSVLAAVANDLNLDSEVLLMDERFSTKEAIIRLTAERATGNVMYVGTLLFERSYLSVVSSDSMAAACILERYVEDEGDTAVTAVPCSFPPPHELRYLNFTSLKGNSRAKHTGSLHRPSHLLVSRSTTGLVKSMCVIRNFC